MGPAEVAPSPQLICELAIVPEVALTVAETFPPLEIVVGLRESEVENGAATVTFSDFMYALPSLSHSFTTTRCVPEAAATVVSNELALA